MQKLNLKSLDMVKILKNKDKTTWLLFEQFTIAFIVKGQWSFFADIGF